MAPPELKVRFGPYASYTTMLTAEGELILRRGEEVVRTATIDDLRRGRQHELILAAIDAEVFVQVDKEVVISWQDPDPLPAGKTAIVNTGNGGLSLTSIQTRFSRDELPEDEQDFQLSLAEITTQTVTVNSTQQLIDEIINSNQDCYNPYIINLASGIYDLSDQNNTVSSFGSNGLPVISCNLTINGGDPNDSSATVIRRLDTAPEFRIFFVNDGGRLTLQHLTVTRGRVAQYSGGAIYFDGSQLNISNSQFTANESLHHGGAIYIRDGNINISNTTFTGNQAVLGSAIKFINHYKSANLQNITVLNNHSTYKGAIHFEAVNLGTTISNAVFLGNSAVSGGSAIYHQDGTVTITNSVFNSNNSDNETVGSAVEYAPRFQSSFSVDLSISDSCIVGNTGIAVSSDSATDPVNATNNWWNDASGPSGAGSGTGDAVNENVDFIPPLLAPPSGLDCDPPPDSCSVQSIQPGNIVEANFSSSEDCTTGEYLIPESGMTPDIAVPFPPFDKQELYDNSSAVEEHGIIQYDAFLGICDPNNPIICAEYVYLAFLDIFTQRKAIATVQDPSQGLPSIRDVLAITYRGELADFDAFGKLIAYEALGRNFFDQQTGACRYRETLQVYDCSYEQMIEWIGTMQLWRDSVVMVGQDQVAVNLSALAAIDLELVGNPQDASNRGYFGYDAGPPDTIFENLPIWRGGQGHAVPSIC